MGALDLIRKGAKGIKNSPFFSKADVVLDELQRGKGTGQEFLTELIKKGVKPTELKDRGIDKALKDAPKMTKAEVQKVFEQKAPPKVQEKVLTGETPDYDEFLEQAAQDVYGRDYWELNSQQTSHLNKMYGEIPTTQYDEYRTPGGDNYREILLKLPAFDDKRLMKLEAELRREETAYRDPMQHQWFRDKVAEVQRLKEEKAAAGTPYTSSHYRNDPNLLAHIRVQDFKTPEGKKVLLVDEVQSDWHQEGRKKGYATPGKLPEGWTVEEVPTYQYRGGNQTGTEFIVFDKTKTQVGLGHPTQEGAIQNATGSQTLGVPDAPFKKNWHELAMKRVLDYAAENGYDTVAITPGAEQAKRYDLSKSIDSIAYDPETRLLDAWDHNRRQVMRREITDESQLEDYIGKEAASKLLQAEPVRGRHLLEGQDLQVGGEGMKGFYDKILPDYLNNYGKKYGAQVGQIDLSYNPNVKQLQQGAADDALLSDLGVEVPAAKAPTYHSFDITPQMREEIKTKGQPMYGKVAMPVLEGLAGGTGAATMGSQMFDEKSEQQVQNPVHFTENPDAMLLELMQRN
jgi:hypothetical protein